MTKIGKLLEKKINESTRSYIGIKYKNGIIEYVYCHFDGYVKGVGNILLKHYSDFKKIKELINLGNISILGAEIGKKQDFKNPESGYTLAYGRDRGEKNQEANKTNRMRDLLGDVSYVYIYLEDENEWIYSDGYKWKYLKDHTLAQQ